LASGGWLCFFPENKFASQADIKAVHCVSDEVKRIEVKTQTPYAFKKMLSYPWSPAQLKKIDKVDEIWFVCTVDNKSRSDIREKTKQWEGHVYSVTSQEMKDYIKTKYRPIFLTGNALTLSHKVQLIVRFFGTPEEIHKNFDFRAVKSYWTYETGLKTNVDILLDINSKKLVYEGSRYPICSLIRTRKYVSRQWKISAGEFVKMAFQVGDLDLKNIDVLKDQLVGVDSTYFTWMINIIEKDLKNAHKNGTEFDIDSDYICNVIDFVFNR